MFLLTYLRSDLSFALMKVLGLDNGESTDEENDTDKYFDAWNFGRTDEDSNFFATATLT